MLIRSPSARWTCSGTKGSTSSSCRTSLTVMELNIRDRLPMRDNKPAGIEAHTWDEITLDELYNKFDCGITDVTYAVAETGTLVIRPTAQHGRGLTLVPMYHIAIVEPRQILPDLLDLFERVVTEADRS